MTFDALVSQGDDVKTSDDAMALSLAWASGKRSWTNLLMDVEPGYESRQETLVRTIEADALEAVKWMRIAAALRAVESVDKF